MRAAVIILIIKHLQLQILHHLSSTSTRDREFEEGGPGRDHEYGRKDDPLTDYRDKEPMTHAKIKEHEPTAVKREMRK